MIGERCKGVGIFISLKKLITTDGFVFVLFVMLLLNIQVQPATYRAW